jgi:hypothetical protein
MAIFANGPGTQTFAAGTAAGTVPVFNTAASGISGTLRNLTIFNSGTVTAYLGGGTAVSTTTGFPLVAGQQMLIEGTVPTLYAITSAVGTTLVAGLATLSTVD